MRTAAALPDERPEGETGWTIADKHWRIVDNYLHEHIGVHLFSICGIEDAFGADYRLVMETRVPIRVRRFWCHIVWDCCIQPDGDGGIRMDYTAIDKIKPLDLMSFRHLAAALTRMTAALTDPNGCPPPSPDAAGPRSATVVQLPVRPAPL